jgi:hypothetical protein
VIRQPRDRRRNRGRLELQERDIELLRALARLRLARTRHLTELCFAGIRRDTAQRRLRALFDSGYLDATSPSLASENLYSLGPLGRALVRESGETVLPLPRGGLAHHLGIVQTWAALASCGIPELALELTRPDWELRAEFGARGLAVVPDLFVVLRLREAALALAVEVDLGTEPLRVLRAKARAYERLRGGPGGLFGWQRFALAVVLGDGRRKEAVERVLRREYDADCATWTLVESPVSSIRKFMGLEGDPLGASPRSKGSVGDASADVATTPDKAVGGLSGE